MLASGVRPDRWIRVSADIMAFLLPLSAFLPKVMSDMQLEKCRVSVTQGFNSYGVNYIYYYPVHDFVFTEQKIGILKQWKFYNPIIIIRTFPDKY